LDETLVSNDFGWLVCLSPKGELAWRCHADNFRAGPAAVGDVDRDGLPEVVYGTENNRILCLEGNGDLKWLHREVGKFGRTNIALADLDGDGYPEAAWSKSFNTPDSRVHVAHAKDGTPFWSAKTILHGYGSISIGDINSDGRPEVVYGDRANTIYVWDSGGTELWRTTTGGRGYMFPQNLADVDGDGTVDVLAMVRDSNEEGKSFFILNGKTGGIQLEMALPGRNSVSPLVADLDADGEIETIVPLSTQKKIEIYRFGAKTGAAAPWPVDRFDSARTGAVSAKSDTKDETDTTREIEAFDPFELETAFVGTNRLRIEWPRPIAERAFLDLVVVAPDGTRTSRIESIDPENLPETVPVHFFEPGKHIVIASLWVENVVPAKKVFSSELEIEVPDFEKLAESIESRLTALQGKVMEIQKEKSGAAKMLFREIASVRGDLLAHPGGMEESKSKALLKLDAQLVEMNRVRSAVDRIDSLFEIASKSPNKSLAVWEDPNPWDLAPSLATAPETFSGTPEVDVWMLGAETEYRAIYVCNLQPRTVDVKFTLPMGSPLALREVLEIPRDDGVWTPDALPFINQSRTLHLAPGEVRQLWVDITSDSLSPIDHIAPIDALPLGEDEDGLQVQFHLHVQPVSLADAPEFAICNWTSPGRLRAMCDQDDFIHYLLNQGMNIVTLGGANRTCDTEGNLVGQPNWSSLDKELEDLDPKVHILLMHGPHVGTPPEVEHGSEVWKKGLQNAMRELAAHLAEKGWGLDRWAYYPVDEPGLFGGTQIKHLREITEPAKEVAPEIQMFTNPAGGVTRENFSDLVDEIDVWQPELAMLRRDPDLVDFFLETQDWLWSYEAPGEAKRLLPLGYYRAQSLTAMWMGLEGAGHWHFGYFSDRNNFWITSAGEEYGDHYLDGSRIVQSRRWLAYMDGAEDARLLLLLKEKMSEVRRRGKEPPALAEAEKLLGPELRHLLRKQWEQDDIARYLIDYEVSYEGVNEIREHAVALILKLNEAIMEGEDLLAGDH